MIALKKLYGDELLRLALVLSLLKADPNDYLERETQQLLTSISNGSDWSLDQEARTLIRPRFVHPKSLDNILINYERELFEELNSLGRYTHTEDNERMWHNPGPVIHTYLLNDVATDTLVQQASSESEQDGVSADDNVAQEVKVTEEDSETNQSDAVRTVTADFLTNHSNSEGFAAESSQPDAVVTLTADFLSNHSESDVFAEIASRSFDVSEFFQQDEMQIKKETQDDDFREVSIKKEQNTEDLYSDNANDDFVPYFTSKSERFEDPTSVFHQNIADLQDYGELFDVKDLKNELEFLDGKRQEEDLEQYLLDNTPLELDPEVYELAPMFDDELVLDVKRERASTSFTSASSSGVTDMDLASVKDIKSEVDEEQQSGDDLTQEDMDLIEVLWKQDVDMGFCLEDPVQLEGPQATKVAGSEAEKHEKLSETLQEKQAEADDIEKVKAALLDPDIKEDDPWAGLSYTVDTETGEYVLQGDLPQELVTEESRFDLLEEALQLVELGDEAENKDEQSKAVEGSSSGGDMLHPAMRHVPHHPLAHYHNQSLMRSMSVEQRWQDLASLLTIPPPPEQYHHHHHHQQHHQPHPHPHPHNIREQYHHYHHHHQRHQSHPHPHSHNISAHGAVGGYAPNYHHTPLPPVPEKHPDHYGAAAPLEGAYKVESAHHPQQHDGLYYQNSTAEMAPPATQDGFLQSILNDEDLQLMDMAMNEGMYTMRMLDGAGAHHNHTHMMMTTAERDSASDSAVSSMGSERVPSLSDGEWCDGSDSAQEFHSSKFRPYEAAAYGRDRSAPHQPQKKHHMFGKRCFQEQPPPQLELPPRPPVVKYECPEQAYHHDPMQMHADFGGRPLVGGHPLQPTLDLNAPHTSHALLQHVVPQGPPGRAGGGARHNHTYAAPPAPPHARPMPTRDKRVRRMTDGSMSDGGSSSGHITRDEKRAKALGESKQRNVRYALAQHGIPLEVHDIINLPMDEFNERLSKHDLSEAQLSLIRDIRRRGKNKVAAQNCRKRKLDQITSLADEVRTVRDRKQRTQRDHHSLLAERQRVKERFAALYRHVFQSLRDSEGRALSSAQYSLQQAADGSVVLVPKMPHNDHSMNRTDDDMDRKTKNYEQ